jgi:hypothetical protein
MFETPLDQYLYVLSLPERGAREQGILYSMTTSVVDIISEQLGDALLHS